MIENENEFEGEEFSLADLASLDASTIEEVRYESLPAGVYVFRGISAVFDTMTNRDEEKRIVAVFKMEVTEVKSCIDRDYKTEEQRDSLIGKHHTEKWYIVPAKAAEGLGRLRASIGDLGLHNEGAFGGYPGAVYPAGHANEGEEIIGIMEGFAGHEFTCKIVTKPRKGDPSQKDSNLKIDPPKKH